MTLYRAALRGRDFWRRGDDGLVGWKHWSVTLFMAVTERYLAGRWHRQRSDTVYLEGVMMSLKVGYFYSAKKGTGRAHRWGER